MNTIIVVFHKKQTNFRAPEGDTVRLDQFESVACVGLDASMSDEAILRETYRKTNSIDQHWSENVDVVELRSNCRSTSVGDLVLVKGQFYAIDMVGCKKVTLA